MITWSHPFSVSPRRIRPEFEEFPGKYLACKKELAREESLDFPPPHCMLHYLARLGEMSNYCYFLVNFGISPR